VRAGEPVSTAEKIVASDTGLSPGATAQITSDPPNRAEERKNSIRTLARVSLNTYYLEERPYSEFP
jgi:hypothetical protein